MIWQLFAPSTLSIGWSSRQIERTTLPVFFISSSLKYDGSPISIFARAACPCDTTPATLPSSYSIESMSLRLTPSHHTYWFRMNTPPFRPQRREKPSGSPPRPYSG